MIVESESFIHESNIYTLHYDESTTRYLDNFNGTRLLFKMTLNLVH